MIQNELLARIDQIQFVSCDEVIDIVSLKDHKPCNECLTCVALLALRSVVELHKEDEYGCTVCNGLGYPCQTIFRIMRKLI